MKTLTLGRTDIRVPDLCLGTMTFGNQTPEADAHRQIDMSLEAGLNFIDTAEMYPVNPVRKETVGRSEEVIGNWFARTGRRAETVIATKVAGDTAQVRDGKGYDGKIVREAVDASLRRLQTDVIDVYQLHWPMRGSYMFRQNWHYDPRGKRRGEVVFLTVGRSKLMVLRLDTCGLFTRGALPARPACRCSGGVEQAGVGDGAI